jgi:hypothetical protein
MTVVDGVVVVAAAVGIDGDCSARVVVEARGSVEQRQVERDEAYLWLKKWGSLDRYVRC